jgi:hypothetical protein
MVNNTKECGYQDKSMEMEFIEQGMSSFQANGIRGN